jgi:heme-degrading monooxygenase HmoA
LAGSTLQSSIELEEQTMTNASWQLAQVNIGRARGAPSDPVMQDFVARLAEINALADQSPGFVWRLQTEDGDATAVRPYADQRILINMSVWTDLEALRAYVFRTAHAAVMRRRREWFERFDGVYLALWWVPAGHRPTVEEAVSRLAHLEAHGPTHYAFSFAQPFDSEGHPVLREGATLDDACPAT